ncbi:MAG: hypothetical protein Q9181_000710 [Wetmoreana brouardii]
MTTDSKPSDSILTFRADDFPQGINEMTYNLPLCPGWEAEENYNFNTFHVSGCNRAKCDGKCGQGNPKELNEQVGLRRANDRERKKHQAAAEMNGKGGSYTSKQKERMEEPGDADFVIGAKSSPMKGGDTPKGRKKGRVRFAE